MNADVLTYLHEIQLYAGSLRVLRQVSTFRYLFHAFPTRLLSSSPTCGSQILQGHRPLSCRNISSR